MQKFLDYFTYMLNFANINASEGFQARLLENIERAMEKLTLEELESLDSLFDAYDLYYQQEVNAVDSMIETINGLDNYDSIVNGFTSEINRLVNHKLETEAKIRLFARVCDLALEKRKSFSR